MKRMSKEEFFRRWESTCYEHDLGCAEGLADIIGDFSFDLDDLGDPEEDKDLRVSISNLIGDYVNTNDEILGLYVELEEEFGEVPAKQLGGDRLTKMFASQNAFMQMLHARGKLPDYPVDMTSKGGQDWVNKFAWDSVRELVEAVQELKNKSHRITDDRTFDREKYLEELADAQAFFLEVLILSGVSDKEFYTAFQRKKEIVKKRLEEGY